MMDRDIDTTYDRYLWSEMCLPIREIDRQTDRRQCHGGGVV